MPDIDILTTTVHPIRLAREDRLWTQEQLARRAKVGVRTVLNIEREHYPSCRMATKRRILDALGIDWSRWREMFPERERVG